VADGYGVAAFGGRLRVLTADPQPDRTGIVGRTLGPDAWGVAALPGSLAAAAVGWPAMTAGPELLNRSARMLPHISMTASTIGTSSAKRRSLISQIIFERPHTVALQ
jgi:hypothetical protein